MTSEQIKQLLSELDLYASNVSAFDFGLPMSEPHVDRMVEIVERVMEREATQ